MRRFVPLLFLLPLLAGCSSSSASKKIDIGPAQTYRLAGFEPASRPTPGQATTVAFTIEQPSGKPLTAYRHGAGPHTGVHLIIVKTDLSTIIHRHPPQQANGHFSQQVVFPSAGRYLVIVDAYPKDTSVVPNFQLFKHVTVRGKATAQPIGGYQRVTTVDGFRFAAPPKPALHASQSALLTFHVTTPAGKPAHFTPWYGALAHAIFLRQGTLDYFHTHVCAPNASGCTSLVAGAKVTGRSSHPGQLTVGVLLPTAGTWKLFLQSEPSAGHIVTVPYVLSVK
jgi:hypothetical protein